MRVSDYIFFVPQNQFIIGFQTIKNKFVYLSVQDYKRIFVQKEFPVEGTPPYKQLTENGFLIKDDVNEYEDLVKEYEDKTYHSSTYYLTLLPSLDCNLRCWYCFEQHIKGSRMTPEVQNNIIEHVKSVFTKKPQLKELDVELFGGEPLLYFQEELYPVLKQIKSYLDEQGKFVHFTFITNAVCITDGFIPLFRELGSVSFQISIDGFKDKHDKVKFIPTTHEGTYNRMIHTVHKLTQELENTFINLRINYDDKTLLHVDSLIQDLVDVDRRKILIHLERVWQTGEHLTHDNLMLKEVIRLFLINGFRYSYLNLFRRSYPCKTSVHNQLTISYDGKIYKCTGRNFTDEMQEGILQTEGTIAWDTEKWEKRMAIRSFDNELCRGCKLLPLCWGPCNQKLLEAANSVKSIKHFCQKNQLEMSLEDYIRFRFNSEILNDKYHEKESV